MEIMMYVLLFAFFLRICVKVHRARQARLAQYEAMNSPEIEYKFNFKDWDSEEVKWIKPVRKNAFLAKKERPVNKSLKSRLAEKEDSFDFDSFVPADRVLNSFGDTKEDKTEELE